MNAPALDARPAFQLSALDCDLLHPPLARMARHYARCSGADPDDLLQEAWVGLLEAVETLDPRIGSPRSHLLLRARWRILDWLKRERLRRCRSLEEYDAGPELQAPGRPCGGPLVERHDWAWFWATLKDHQRSILDGLLRGQTWREVGAELGCSSANVAYHVRQIRKVLSLRLPATALDTRPSLESPARPMPAPVPLRRRALHQ